MSLWALVLSLRCGLTFVSAISHLVMLYLSVVRQEHALQQGDSTFDEFYTHSSAIWRQLESLCTAICGTSVLARLEVLVHL
jgi:hypothetical protein